MARERFRDVFNARFVARNEALRIILNGGTLRRDVLDNDNRVVEYQVIDNGYVQSPYGEAEPFFPPNWDADYSSRWDVIWRNDGGLDRNSLRFEAPESGMRSYRLHYMVPSDPYYPTGYASSRTYSSRDWPAGINERGTSGVAAVVWVR